jgi:hypothetical protein
MDINLIPNKCFNNSKLVGNRELLSIMCKDIINISNPIISEVGVYQGYYSEKLVNIFNPSKFYLIDTFNVDDSWTNKFTKDNHLDYVQQKFKSYNNIEIIQALSWDGLSKLENNYLDFIYIDAGHAYEHVKSDINICINKIKSGGIIQFNDYTNYSICEKFTYGVFDAVNEFIINYKPIIIGLSLGNNGYHDIAVQIFK